SAFASGAAAAPRATSRIVRNAAFRIRASWHDVRLRPRVAMLRSRPKTVSSDDRTVHHGDGVAWLAQAALGPEHAIVTSLPDLSELPELGLDGWRRWFMGAARALIHWIPGDGVAIFFQSDIRFQ